MGFFKKDEKRADDSETKTETGDEGLDVILRAALAGSPATRNMAMQIPTINGGIDLISGVVSQTPIRLYKEENGKSKHIEGDIRERLLNDETGDTMDANQFWRAMVADYYLGKGGYAYINRSAGTWKSIHYVKESEISIVKNSDPIFKDYDILVQGKSYYPWQFLKVLRHSRDGMTGEPITNEVSAMVETAYESLRYERNMVKKGGNKKGFLKSENKLEKETLTALKEAFQKMYRNGDESVVVLNKGVDFKESSNTSVEMQLNENKTTNAAEFSKIFHVSVDAISGKDSDIRSIAKLAAIPLMHTIQTALNAVFLDESEKGSYYWAFDTKEMLKGDMMERFTAYKTALDANFMNVDEIRFMEDMDPWGIKWMRLGLQDVLYDPKNGTIYTPNTNQTAQLTGKQPVRGGDGE